MKRTLVVTILLLALTASAAMGIEMFGVSSSADYTTTSDTAVTIATAFAAGGGTSRFSSSPKSVTIQAKDNNVLVSFYKLCAPHATLDNGALIMEGSAVRWPSPQAYTQGYICPGTSGVNARVNIIVEW